MKRYNQFSLQDVEQLLQLKTWWAVWGVLPLANRMVVFFVNYSNFKPNMITGAALIIRILSGLFFLSGDYPHMMSAGFLYYMAYVLDCVDGPVARLTGNTSEFGRYFDHMSDLMGDLFILCCLAAGQNFLFSTMVISMCIMHVFEAYVSYLAGLVLSEKKLKLQILGSSDNIIIRAYQNYRNFFFSRNLKSFFSFPDYGCIVFIVFPVLRMPLAGIRAGFYMLALIVLYTVFSTFWAIHSRDAKFP